MKDDVEIICKGCKSYNDGIFSCLMGRLISKKIGECPCRYCLIKVMCTKPCEVFMELLRKAEKYQFIEEDV